MRNLINRAIHNSDQWVVVFLYVDTKGQLSKRVVSPIRFVGADRFLGLCLSREEPRQFYLERCKLLELRPACDYVMPVALEVISA